MSKTEEKKIPTLVEYTMSVLHEEQMDRWQNPENHTMGDGLTAQEIEENYNRLYK